MTYELLYTQRTYTSSSFSFQASISRFLREYILSQTPNSILEPKGHSAQLQDDCLAALRPSFILDLCLLRGLAAGLARRLALAALRGIGAVGGLLLAHKTGEVVGCFLGFVNSGLSVFLGLAGGGAAEKTS